MRFLVGLIAVVGLSACTPQTVDDALQANLPGTCHALAGVYGVLVKINDAHPLPARLVDKAEAAVAGVDTICDDPTQVTTANALVVVTDASAAVARVLKDAERLEDARTAAEGP